MGRAHAKAAQTSNSDDPCVGPAARNFAREHGAVAMRRRYWVVPYPLLAIMAACGPPRASGTIAVVALLALSQLPAADGFEAVGPLPPADEDAPRLGGGAGAIGRGLSEVRAARTPSALAAERPPAGPPARRTAPVPTAEPTRPVRRARSGGRDWG